MKQEVEKNKKIKSIIICIIIICIIIISVIISKLIIQHNNKYYIEKYVGVVYPDYTIVDKSYEYLDWFWSGWYGTGSDDFRLEIICNTALVNNKTGMKITIPFYHSKYKEYRDTRYARKNIKNMVAEYEKYWNSINKLKDEYNVELNISNVKITEASNCDISEITVYLMHKDDTKIDKIISDINNINTSLNINNINYVVAKENYYKSLKPWIESNEYLIVPNSMKEIESEKNFDLYIERYKRKDNKLLKWVTRYYLEKNK